jgi:DNA-binding beta-propeller fold protein YncE
MEGAADGLYWSNTDPDSSVVSSAKLDGSGGSDFSFTGTTVKSPSGTAIDAVAGVIYWANGGNNTISWARMNGPGGTLNTTNATVNLPRGLAIDPTIAKRVYWANAAGGAGGSGSISWAAMSGSGGGDLISGPNVNSPDGVAVDPADGTIYWANSAGSGPGPGPGSIMSARTDGSEVAPVLDTGMTVDSPAGLALDPDTGTMYWANSPAVGSGSIAYWNLDTDSGGVLSTDAPVDHPQGIAIDPAAGKLYWANAGANTIAFANLDGSGGGTLATSGATVGGPAFPVLLVAPAGTGAPRVTGTPSAGSSLTCQKASWAGDVLPAFYYRAPRTITWQWSRNGTAIAGATTTSYTPTAAGSYTCQEMAKNHAGTTTQTSDPFLVSAQPLGTGAGASSVAATSAVLNGTIVPQYAATSYHFEYGITAEYGARMPASDAPVGSDGAAYPVAQAISGLEPNRTYHFRLVASNAKGTAYGADQTFTTSAGAAVVTYAATSLSIGGAVLNGSVNPENLMTGYYFEFGRSAGYGARVPASEVPVGADHAVSQDLSGLPPATTFHYRLVAVNAVGVTYGADATFTTATQPLVKVPGRVGTIGASLRLTLTCAGGAGQDCHAEVSARLIERLSADGKRIVGLSSVPVGGRSRTVVVASQSFDLAAGSRREVSLRLNTAGRMLRARFKTLPARVEVSRKIDGRTQTIRTARAMFGADPPKIRIIGRVLAKGPSLTIRLGCGGTPSQRCAGFIEVTTFEKLGGDGRTITELSRAPSGPGKVLTIARAPYSLPARGTSQRTITLTPTGKTLLARFGRIPAGLTIIRTENGYSITGSRADTTFRH